jgi:L-2-hydroxyglutarate oxidase LhgO
LIHTDYEIVVIGGGVVGLACAMFLSRQHSVLLVERHNKFGQETSSRNSQVIHAGMYYPSNSLKAELCVKGNVSIYEWASKHSVPFQQIGKYIIAIDTRQEEELDTIFEQGKKNGVDSLVRLSAKEVLKDEPNLKLKSAIFSPNTGIIDSHQLQYSFLVQAQENGCDFLWKHTLTGAEKDGSHYQLNLTDRKNTIHLLSCNSVINSAGLDSDLVSRMVGLNHYQLHYVKGNYFRVASKKAVLVRKLIYPAPAKHLSGLGVHVTKELDGSMRLGPDVEYLEHREQNYSVNPALQEKFYHSVSAYINGLDITDLYPDTAGIRPKLQAKGEPFQDFIIQEETANGYPNWVNLIGIESPGLTASLEIAKMVEKMI